mgnify:CR=1 FL=1
MKSFLSTYIEFSDSEYDVFISKAKLVEYKKKECLISPRKATEKLFFIKKGLLRGYRLIDGIEVTHHFFAEKWFATDYESYLTGKPGELHLETLTDVSVYEFNKSVLYSFFQDYPTFEKIRGIIAETAYLQMVNRIKNFQSKDLKKRYDNLIGENPKLFNLVPQKHIASYLGVAPQSLSRIKGVK